MSPQLRAQIELTEEMRAILDELFKKQRASDAVIARSRIWGLEAVRGR